MTANDGDNIKFIYQTARNKNPVYSPGNDNNNNVIESKNNSSHDSGSKTRSYQTVVAKRLQYPHALKEGEFVELAFLEWIRVTSEDVEKGRI